MNFISLSDIAPFRRPRLGRVSLDLSESIAAIALALSVPGVVNQRPIPVASFQSIFARSCISFIIPDAFFFCVNVAGSSHCLNLAKSSRSRPLSCNDFFCSATFVISAIAESTLTSLSVYSFAHCTFVSSFVFKNAL